jgi:hypothetical protein
MVKEHITDPNIWVEDVYGMDESGSCSVPMGGSVSLDSEEPKLSINRVKGTRRMSPLS